MDVISYSKASTNAKVVTDLTNSTTDDLFRVKNSLSTRAKDGLLLESFSTTAGFSTTGASLALDATNTKYGGNAIALTCSTPGTEGKMTKTLAVPWVLTSMQNMELRIYIAANANDIANIIIILHTGSNNAGLRQTADISHLHSFHVGWNTIRFSPSDLYTVYLNAGVTPSITSVDYVVTPQPAKAPVVVFDSLKMDCIDTPRFVFAFDDAHKSTYDIAFPALSAHGWVGSAAIPHVNVAGVNKMTLADLTDLHNNGWDIINHGDQHGDYAAATYEYTYKDMYNGKKYLSDNGLTRGNDMLIYPTGWTAMGATVARDMGLTYARSVNLSVLYFPHYDPLRLEAINPTNTSHETTMKVAIDRAIATCGTVLTLYHNLVETAGSDTETSIAEFEATVAYLASLGTAIEVVSLSQLFSEMAV